MSSIYNIKSKTVESVVQDYRKQVGLDILISESQDKELSPVKESTASFKPISIRHIAEKKSIIDLIESDENLQKIITSLCEHSGGNRSTPSIIKFLRDFLEGKARVDYNDDKLVSYIEDCRSKFKEDRTEDQYTDVGLIGLDTQEGRADKADYIAHDGAH
jgi:hypothetical protein